MSLVGITGRAGAGKDSLGAAFVRAGYRRIAFADPLKEATAVIAGEPSHLFFTAEGKSGFSPVLNATRRAALQGIGKAVRDALDVDVWVRRALDEWHRLGRPKTVITDVRYDNEAGLIRKFGGTVIRVVRPGYDLLQGVEATHESEAGIPDRLVDYELVNNGTLAELHIEGRKIIQRLVPGQGQLEMSSYGGSA